MKISNSDYETDDMIDDPKDQRFGITLLIRPSEEVKAKIQEMLWDFQSIEPRQYYYPATDIHITVLSIISCYDGFTLNSINVHDYLKVINQSLETAEPFTIHTKGITASPSCIMVQGYPSDHVLEDIRNKLRSNFSHSNLEHSIDKRYTISMAHSTVIRLKNDIEDIPGFVQLMKKYENYNFGTFKVEEIELVFNDWYLKIDKSRTLNRFKL